MRPELLDYELLVKAREWLSDPDHWQKGSYGYYGPNSDEPLTSTCAVGALAMAAGIEPNKISDRTSAYRLLKAALPGSYIFHSLEVPNFNDASLTKHADVLALFDRAISKAYQLATAPAKG